jgi:superfamily II DNA/RNA helicase
MANIQRAQYIKPRKIQALSIPLIMDGRFCWESCLKIPFSIINTYLNSLKIPGHDIKGLAETGSGKSAAFLLPIINQIIVKKKQGDYQSKRICPYALIIEPTRELVYQVYDQARKFTDGLPFVHHLLMSDKMNTFSQELESACRRPMANSCERRTCARFPPTAATSWSARRVA